MGMGERADEGEGVLEHELQMKMQMGMGERADEGEGVREHELQMKM